MEHQTLEQSLRSGALDQRLAAVYGAEGLAAAKERCAVAAAGFTKTFESLPEAFFSAPGRTELGGNHTDHQHGRVLAAAVDLDILAAAAPDVSVVIHTARVTEDNLDALLADCRIVCEAFDTPEDKALLVNAVLERFPDKYVVAASGMAGLGPANEIRTRRITSHFYLCGDGTSQLTPGGGLLPSRVMLCAAHQAHAVLRILAEEPDV